MTVLAPEPMIITTVDGESRPVTRFYDGGAWDCPFCSAACDPGSEHYEQRGWDRPCVNPACIAGGAGTPERLAQVRLQQQRDREASSQRAWLSAYHEQAAQTREQARTEAVRAFTTLAQESGHCMSCWGRSTSWGLYLARPRIVRHRKPENCPAIRRRKA